MLLVMRTINLSKQAPSVRLSCGTNDYKRPISDLCPNKATKAHHIEPKLHANELLEQRKQLVNYINKAYGHFCKISLLKM